MSSFMLTLSTKLFSPPPPPLVFITTFDLPMTQFSLDAMKEGSIQTTRELFLHIDDSAAARTIMLY